MHPVLNRSLLIVPLLAPLLGAQGRWTQQTPSTMPTGRHGLGVVADLRRGVAVMFGGADVAGSRNDTWEWNGTNWTQRSPTTSPPPRQQFAMAYDLIRGVTLLFGGAYIGDTWQYNGTNWTQLSPTSSPSARCCAYMAFDLRRARIVLFGGYGQSAGMLGDTWEWDGTNWTQVQVANSPSPRCCGSMVYDSKRGVCVLFGGASTLNSDSAETWEYNGTTWTMRTPPTSPSARRGSTLLVYDVSRERTVLFGGGSGGSGNPRYNDTWEWDGSYWIQRNPSIAPSVRFLQGMAYLPNKGYTLMFGGLSSTTARPNDTWTYTATNNAQFERYGSACRGSTGIPNHDRTSSGPWLGSTFIIRTSSLPQTGAAALFLGSSRTMWGTVPLPLKLDALGMTGCELGTGPDVVVPASIASGVVDWRFPIPNSASLAGVPFFSQAYVLDPGANAFGATLSNGCMATIGDL
ncbi:MAG: hypothetical protein KDC95_11480 [Planctomycetes bacterium]|nr:hypothetical protein [Planctomycetota bacterium]